MRVATLQHFACAGEGASSADRGDARPSEDRPAPVPRSAAGRAPGAGLRCIVVEDDPGVLGLMRQWLEELGIEVRALASAADAQALAAREDFHVIVTDVVMDGMDGIELMRSLRKNARRPKVIGITGVADGENLGRVMRTLGAEGFLLKPFGRDELVAALERALGRKLGAA